MLKKKNIGSHEDFSRQDKFKVASDRNFGIVFACVFSIVGLWGLVRGSQYWMFWLGAAMVFVVLVLFKPRLLAPLNFIWMKLGLLLFKIVSPVMLAVLFYGCIAPIGLILRLMKKDILNLQPDANAQTYWITRVPPGPEPKTLKNQY